ncbi:hypothetical protein TRVL_00612 [Trypanosoma vivax]|nr:hypothetical protein TRVL_00612 [Trypanosoma vivax]
MRHLVISSRGLLPPLVPLSKQRTIAHVFYIHLAPPSRTHTVSLRPILLQRYFVSFSPVSDPLQKLSLFLLDELRLTLTVHVSAQLLTSLIDTTSSYLLFIFADRV